MLRHHERGTNSDSAYDFYGKPPWGKVKTIDVGIDTELDLGHLRSRSILIGVKYHNVSKRIAYGLFGPATEDELTPSKVQW